MNEVNNQTLSKSVHTNENLSNLPHPRWAVAPDAVAAVAAAEMRQRQQLLVLASASPRNLMVQQVQLARVQGVVGHEKLIPPKFFWAALCQHETALERERKMNPRCCRHGWRYQISETALANHVAHWCAYFER